MCLSHSLLHKGRSIYIYGSHRNWPRASAALLTFFALVYIVRHRECFACMKNKKQFMTHSIFCSGFFAFFALYNGGCGIGLPFKLAVLLTHIYTYTRAIKNQKEKKKKSFIIKIFYYGLYKINFIFILI